MNSSTVSSFFSRDVFLRRQARTRKRPTPTKLCPSTSSTNNPLAMIKEEEDEPRTPTASPSRSPSPGQYSPNLSAGGTRNPGVKSKRRHANLSVSDIRIAKTALIHNDHDFTQQSSALLSAPRPAPRPPVSPTPSPGHSPDPFSLRFHDGSLRFPHPPTPSPSSIPSYYRTGSESPTPSMSSCSPSTSPESRSNGLPTTPSSSDDEFPSYYSSPLPSFNPRRVSIKPLVITKHNSSSTSHDSLPSISTSLIEPFKNTHQECLTPSPYAPEEYSDSDSDSEWYNREISSVLTLCSPTSNFSQNSRPDSICVPVSPISSPTPTSTSSTPSQGVRGVQLDTPSCRRRSRISIPNYPPPPVPVVSEHLRSPPSTPSKVFRRSRTLSVTPPPRRPPPRSSIPADCVLVDEAYIFSDDSDSVFSFSLYDTSPTTIAPFSESPKSCYSQQSFQSPNPSPFPASFPSTPSSSFPPPSADEEMDFPVDEIEFDMDLDRSMMLPLSIPNSPIDLEADIASGLAELRSAPQPQSVSVSDADVSTTGATLSNPPRKSAGDDDSRELRSRWSSSTLGSIREEHARRSGLGLAASAKLRAYFGSPSPSPSPRSKSKSKSRGPAALASASASSRRSGSVSVSGAGSAIPLTPLTPTSPARRFRHARRESDVMAMGYGYGYGLPSPGQPPLRRRGSVTPSVSDAGSEESTSSAGSSGLRRKPIPVEMFLRSAA